MLNRRVRACGYLLGFALSWAVIQLAWAEQLPIRIYRTADGLARDSVFSIAADKNGYLWFGTTEGLSRFDGLGLATSPLTVSPGENDERPAARKMIARVVREFDLEPGIPVKRVISEEIFGADNIIYLPDHTEACRAVWERELPLTTKRDEDARDRAKYCVIIEERESRLPATYTNEPVSPNMTMGRACSGEFLDEVLVESGPRFLARIPL